MTFIQKKENIKKKNKHSAIFKIPDIFWEKIKSIFPKEKPLNTVDQPIVPYRKVIDGILYVLRTRGCQWKILPKEYVSGSTCHRRFQKWNSLGIFKKAWTRILKIYEDCIGINWPWPFNDSISIKSSLVGDDDRKESTDRSKLGRTKRHILTDKKGIPLSVVISSASAHEIKLVIDVVDNSVIKRRRQRQLPSHKPKPGTRRRLQHLCLDKAYNSELEEQELIKRGYVLHIPYKKKKGKEVDDEKTITIPNLKKHSPKRWVVGRTNSWHNRFRKLFTRYEKNVENYLGLVQLSCCIII